MASVYKKVKNDSGEEKMEEGGFILVLQRRWICELTCGGGKEQGRLSRSVRTEGEDQQMLVGFWGGHKMNRSQERRKDWA